MNQEENMSDIANPYQSPEAKTEAIKPLSAQGFLTESMLKNLSDASPWLQFLGVMGFIGAGLCALGGLGSLIVIPFTTSAINFLGDELGGLSVFFGTAGPIMIVYAIYMIGAGALMFFPALFTYRFGAKLRSYVQNNTEQDLEAAFKNNKSLWKFNGILMIIGLAAIPVLIIIGIVVAVAAVAMF